MVKMSKTAKIENIQDMKPFNGNNIPYNNNPDIDIDIQFYEVYKDDDTKQV